MVVYLYQLPSITTINTRHSRRSSLPNFFILATSKPIFYQTQCCHLVCHCGFDAQVFFCNSVSVALEASLQYTVALELGLQYSVT
jgi:hypothetical protein